MIRISYILISALGLASCATHYTGSGQNEGDPNINCSGLVGQPLHRCAALATGYSETVARSFDQRCHARGQHMAMSRATGVNRQIVVCQQGRASIVASNRQQTPFQPHSVSLDPNSPKSITFGVKLSTQELAKKQGIPDRGGIKQGLVIVVPSSDEWSGVFSRSLARRAVLHIKAIHQGDSIAKANQSASEGSARLVDGQIPTLPHAGGSKNNQCKIILDGTGEPITLRESEAGINRYAFTHFVNDEKFEHETHKRQVTEAERAWKTQVQKLKALKSSLANNRAYQRGQCVTIKQRTIPPAPKRIDPNTLEINAHGACVNLIGSRFTEEQVIDALESAGRWDVTKNYQKWTFGEKMSCAAGTTVSEFESLKTRAIDQLAPNLGKEYFRQAIRSDIDSCISKVKRRCDDGYSAWVARKRQITNEPRQLKNQCIADKRKLVTYDYSQYNKTKSALAKVKILRDKANAQQNKFTQHSVVPFTDKRTYCQ